MLAKLAGILLVVVGAGIVGIQLGVDPEGFSALAVFFGAVIGVFGMVVVLVAEEN